MFSVHLILSRRHILYLQRIEQLDEEVTIKLQGLRREDRKSACRLDASTCSSEFYMGFNTCVPYLRDQPVSVDVKAFQFYKSSMSKHARETQIIYVVYSSPRVKLRICNTKLVLTYYERCQLSIHSHHFQFPPYKEAVRLLNYGVCHLIVDFHSSFLASAEKLNNRYIYLPSLVLQLRNHPGFVSKERLQSTEYEACFLLLELHVHY